MWWFSRKKEQGRAATIEEMNQLISMVSKGLADVSREISKTRSSFDSSLGNVTRQVAENNEEIFKRSKAVIDEVWFAKAAVIECVDKKKKPVAVPKKRGAKK